MIEPTVGRIVWYWESSLQGQPLAAIVTYVHSNVLINLCVFNKNGIACGVTDIDLKQGIEIDIAYPYAEWMPFQKGQAAKTEELEKKVNKITYEKTAPERNKQASVTHTFKE